MSEVAKAATAQSALISPLHPPVPSAHGERVFWGRLYGSATSLSAASAAREHPGLTLALVADVQSASRAEAELRFFLAGSGIEVLAFPDLETLPYDVFSPLPELISERLSILYRLTDIQRGVLVVPVSTLLQRLPPRSYLEGHTLMLRVGDRLDPDRFRQRLERAGYRCVSQVVTHG